MRRPVSRLFSIAAAAALLAALFLANNAFALTINSADDANTTADLSSTESAAAGAASAASSSADATAASAATAEPSAAEFTPADDHGSAVKSSPTPIDGTHFFDDFQRRAADSYRKAPLSKLEMLKRQRLDINGVMRSDSAGSVVNFNTRNIAANQNEEIPAVCARVGKNCYVFVSKSVTVDAAYLDRLVKEFDDNIYPNNTAAFGTEWKPGVDNDNRVTLLLLDIKDGMESSNAYVAGYFFAGDEYSKSQLPTSNEREMIYMDVIQGGFTDDKGFRRFCGTIAHELQHMIHWHHDPKEVTWVNEGMSQYASFINGYGHPGQVFPFFKAPDTSLVAWRSDRGLPNYGAIYMFSYYLVNTVVAIATSNTRAKQLEFTRALVASPEHGIAGIMSILKTFGVAKPFNDIYLDWLTANAINNPKVTRRFGYDQNLGAYLPISRFVHGTFPVNNMRGTLDCYGGLYIVCSIDPEYLKQANLGTDVAIGGIQPGGYVMRINLTRTDELGGNQLVGRLLKVRPDNTYSGDDFIVGPDNNYSFTVPGFPSEFKTLIFTFGVVSSEQLATSRPTYGFAYDFVPVNSNMRYMVSAYNQLVSDNSIGAANKNALLSKLSGDIAASIATNEGAAEFESAIKTMKPAEKAGCATLLKDLKKKASFEGAENGNNNSDKLTRSIDSLEKKLGK